MCTSTNPDEPLSMTKDAHVEAKRHAAKIVRRLERGYPQAKCALGFISPLELLVATILSAQCTDQQVNRVTKELFRKYRSAADFARVKLGDLEKDIQSTGFFRNKAKNIQQCCRQLVESFNGHVPRDLDTLVGLPGIGRKTANVILGAAYGTASGVAVDTHVARLSRRLGLSRQKDAVKIERDLMSQLPKKQWIVFSHQMILHGRSTCTARKPNCDECVLADVCPRIGVET